jgi:hypothetical protein
LPLAEIYPYAVWAISWLAAIGAGTWAWRAGGRYQELCIPIGFLVSTAPWCLLVTDAWDPRQLLAAWALALLFAWPLILCGSMLAALGSIRASAWGQTTLAAQCLPLAVAFGDWIQVAIFSGLLAYAWSWDRLCRPGGWVETRADPWLQAHVVASASVAAALATAYPAIAVSHLRHGPAAWQDMAHDAIAMFPVHAIPPGTFLSLIVVVYTAAFTIALMLRTDRDRIVVVMAPAPFAFWMSLALVLGKSAGDFVAYGVAFTLAMLIATWASTVVGAAPVRVAH